MDDLENQRNEKLIEEREEFEKEFFSRIVDEMIESDALDKLIADRFEYIDDHFDFIPTPEYDYLEELYYKEHDPVLKSQEKAEFEDYMPHDNFDNLDGYDYPEGPKENLSGTDYYMFAPDIAPDYEIDEPDFELLYEQEEPDILEPPEEYFDIPDNFENSDEYYADLYEDMMNYAIDDDEQYESYMKSIIEQHEKDEKDFLDSLLIDTIQEEYYFQKAIDELLFEEIDIDYEPEMFDYEQEDYWYYDEECYPPDESIVDPFDSFGEIDYPEGEPKHEYEPPYIEYDDDLEKDIELYLMKKEIQETPPEEYIPKYPKELEEEIIEPPEEAEFRKRNEELIKNQETVEKLFKQYISKNDDLNMIIKEKIKEKKFKK